MFLDAFFGGDALEAGEGVVGEGGAIEGNGVGAEGGGKEVGLEGRRVPPEVGDLGPGGGGVLLRLRGRGAGRVVGKLELVERKSPVVEVHAVGRHAEVERLVGGRLLGLLQQLLEARAVVDALGESRVALAESVALRGGDGAHRLVEERELVLLREVRDRALELVERRKGLVVRAAAERLLEGAREEEVLLRRRLRLLRQGERRSAYLRAGLLVEAEGLHLGLHDLLDEGLGLGEFLFGGHGARRSCRQAAEDKQRAEDSRCFHRQFHFSLLSALAMAKMFFSWSC